MNDGACTLRLDHAEDGLTSIELLCFEQVELGPTIGILGIEATAGSAFVGVDDWPAGFGDAPLGITVAAVER